MKKSPPSISTYGRIDHIIQKIKEAKTPERFTNDFLRDVILAKGTNDRAFISLSKRCGLLNEDATPTERYRRLRNKTERVSKGAMAEGIRQGYADLYALNEYVHKLSENDLEGLVLQFTGDEKGSKRSKNIVKTFLALKKHADFEIDSAVDQQEETEDDSKDREQDDGNGEEGFIPAIGLSYQINLVLPKTDDIAVFNAIFRSLKANLLKK